MIRELEFEDISADYFRFLCQLSGEEKKDEKILMTTLCARARFRFWCKYEDNHDHQVFIYEHEGNIIGTATVLVENKLLHYGSRVGHIEDVVVDKETRLSGIGKQLIEKCVEFSRQRDCYKVILDCGDHNVPFYESCGFKEAEGCMRLDL